LKTLIVKRSTLTAEDVIPRLTNNESRLTSAEDHVYQEQR
jgi:hypothetical protein